MNYCLPGRSSNKWVTGSSGSVLPFSHNGIEDSFLEIKIFFSNKTAAFPKRFWCQQDCAVTITLYSLLVRDSYLSPVWAPWLPLLPSHAATSNSCHRLPPRSCSFHPLIPLIHLKDPASVLPAGGHSTCMKYSLPFIAGHLVHHTANPLGLCNTLPSSIPLFVTANYHSDLN